MPPVLLPMLLFMVVGVDLKVASGRYGMDAGDG
jgi:hypothetical protein